MENTKNILIINQPLGNRGDESAHRALMRGLNRKFPYAKITVLFFLREEEQVHSMIEGSKNNYVNITQEHMYRFTLLVKYAVIFRCYLFLTYIIPFLKKQIRFYKNADLVICAPGGICMGGFQNWNHLYQLLLARHFRKRLVYYSRSFGPFPTMTYANRVFKKYSLKLLHYFDFLSIRDAQTMKLAECLQVPYVPSIDTAFLEVPRGDVPENLRKMIGKSDYVVFVPNSLTWHYQYKKVKQTDIDVFYREIFVRLRDVYPDYKVLLLPQLFGVHNGDWAYFKKLVTLVNDKDLLVVDECYGSDVQQAIIREARFVIGARYHSIVFAINNKTPFVALCYEHKMIGLLESLGLEMYGVDISSVWDKQSKKSLVTEIMDKINIDQNLDKQQALAAKMAQMCFEQMSASIGKNDK